MGLPSTSVSGPGYLSPVLQYATSALRQVCPILSTSLCQLMSHVLTLAPEADRQAWSGLVAALAALMVC